MCVYVYDINSTCLAYSSVCEMYVAKLNYLRPIPGSALLCSLVIYFCPMKRSFGNYHTDLLMRLYLHLSSATMYKGTGATFSSFKGSSTLFFFSIMIGSIATVSD